MISVFLFCIFVFMQNRALQLKERYVQLIDKHLDDLVNGKVEIMFEIKDFAEQMAVHPTHLSNTIKEITGTSPCGIYQKKLMKVTEILLADGNNSIYDIARILTFEPSQFTKWFKRFFGITPREYRKQLKQLNSFNLRME
jgi:AraC-like DNA-binding protein